MPLYLFHPPERYLPGLVAWLAEVQRTIGGDAVWLGWEIHRQEYDQNCGFSVGIVATAVRADPGPVILVEPVRTPSRVELERAIRGRAIVYPRAICCPEDLLAVFEEAKRDYNAGEPRLPRKLVVGVLIVRKLEKLQMWGGKDKGFLRGDDLPKGRGIPDDLADAVHEVANYLKNHDVLQTKRSQGRTKYALNDQNRPAIYRILERRSFEESLMRILERDPTTVPARLLDP
jgi:hypothetical protein